MTFGTPVHTLFSAQKWNLLYYCISQLQNMDAEIKSGTAKAVWFLRRFKNGEIVRASSMIITWRREVDWTPVHSVQRSSRALAAFYYRGNSVALSYFFFSLSDPHVLFLSLSSIFETGEAAFSAPSSVRLGLFSRRQNLALLPRTPSRLLLQSLHYAERKTLFFPQQFWFQGKLKLLERL